LRSNSVNADLAGVILEARKLVSADGCDVECQPFVGTSATRQASTSMDLIVFLLAEVFKL
jgi:hypothetical protein